MTTRHTASATDDFATSAARVVAHLSGHFPDLGWVVGRTVSAGREVVAVSDAAAAEQVGDVGDVVDVVEAARDGAPPARRLLGPAGEELGALWAVGTASHLTVHGRSVLADPLVDLVTHLLTVILNADVASVASARRSQVLQEQALSDELTGLLNRRGWTQVLEAQPAHPPAAVAPAVIIIDLDRLKEVNDDQGHVAGDEYLQLAAMTLSAACREGDLVARLGGDEFGVLVEPSRPDAAERLLDRIREALDAAGVAASMGCAHDEPEGGLMRTWWRADRAMYAEKQYRRSRGGSAVVLA